MERETEDNTESIRTKEMRRTEDYAQRRCICVPRGEPKHGRVPPDEMVCGKCGWCGRRTNRLYWRSFGYYNPAEGSYYEQVCICCNWVWYRSIVEDLCEKHPELLTKQGQLHLAKLWCHLLGLVEQKKKFRGEDRQIIRSLRKDNFVFCDVHRKYWLMGAGFFRESYQFTGEGFLDVYAFLRAYDECEPLHPTKSQCFEPVEDDICAYEGICPECVDEWVADGLIEIVGKREFRITEKGQNKWGTSGCDYGKGPWIGSIKLWQSDNDASHRGKELEKK